jgi:hypothetical protein
MDSSEIKLKGNLIMKTTATRHFASVLFGLLLASIPGGVYGEWAYTTLDYPDTTYTLAFGTSGGNIVGEYKDIYTNYHGFLYDGTTWSPLDYPGATETWANGISGGNIVGAHIDSSGNKHGFFYDGTNWSSLDYPGATHTNACGISGGNIAGYYCDADSTWHGFLATPVPEPGTLVLLGIGGISLLACAWRRRK